MAVYSQVKIGNNPSQINATSILELESSDKVLVISRMSNSEMNNIQPLTGAMVYNTSVNCIFMYNGSSWVSLCNIETNVTTSSTAPTNNDMGDFWINDTANNVVSIWNGSAWIPTDSNPRRGNGSPTSSNAQYPIAGEVYVDQTTGEIYAYNGTTWVNSNFNFSTDNGISIATNNTIQLGGTLIKPTILETSAINTLAITGLEDGDVIEDDIVTVNQTTGELRKINSTNLFREDVTEIIANNGQLVFNGLTLFSTDKINVYRNGVRIDFTIINNTTIEVEPEAVCYQGDQIKIVQFY
ncbi:hypothetical protein C7447_1057 [Tenacibaculum adriaticum]|uniref:Uncharacterized protein n=2 Tax=Tenacibaculum adriaticum TaxID=413713 RepID=A0A5S5DMW3_9FLAO|nr:hypothetical protein C7447_1057 [Tenacibaculum adriaticum]